MGIRPTCLRLSRSSPSQKKSQNCSYDAPFEMFEVVLIESRHRVAIASNEFKTISNMIQIKIYYTNIIVFLNIIFFFRMKRGLLSLCTFHGLSPRLRLSNSASRLHVYRFDFRGRFSYFFCMISLLFA